MGIPNLANEAKEETLMEFCSNFDGVIDQESVATMRATPGLKAGYSAWEWNGTVWMEADGTWKCEVWRYHALQITIEAPSPEDLVKAVCSQWGSE